MHLSNPLELNKWSSLSNKPSLTVLSQQALHSTLIGKCDVGVQPGRSQSVTKAKPGISIECFIFSAGGSGLPQRSDNHH